MTDKHIKTIADRLDVFTSTDNRPFVNIPCPANTRAFQSVPLRSAAFRTWFHGEYASACDGIPAARAFHSVLHHLEGRAFRHSDSTRIRVGRRVAARTDSYATAGLLIDLASPSGEIVEITPAGWSVKNDPSAPFEPSPLAIPIPNPTEDPNTSLETLRGCLNLDRAGWLLCLSWVLAALRPDGPYPVLILQGPSGSGKSLIARLLRTLVEPSTVPLAATPRSVRDLVGIARRHWVVALDHISALSARVADAICCLTSGLGIVAQEDVRSRGAAPFEQTLKRPVILTVTDRFTCPPDLARRALIVNCPAIPPDRCRTEADILQTLNDGFPAIFGALCSVLSVALRNSAELLRPAAGPHCPDALAWAIAAAPALSCTPEELKEAFAPNTVPACDAPEPQPDALPPGVPALSSPQPDAAPPPLPQTADPPQADPPETAVERPKATVISLPSSPADFTSGLLENRTRPPLP